MLFKRYRKAKEQCRERKVQRIIKKMDEQRKDLYNVVDCMLKQDRARSENNFG